MISDQAGICLGRRGSGVQIILKELFASSISTKKADVDDLEAVGSLKVLHRPKLTTSSDMLN